MENLTQNQRVHAIIHQENLNRILRIGSIYTLLECLRLILVAIGYLGDETSLISLVIIAFNLIILPVIYYQKKTYYINIMMNSILEKIYFIVLLAWGSAYTLLYYVEKGDMTFWALILVVLPMVITMRREYIHFLLILNGALFLFIGNRMFDETYFTVSIIVEVIVFTAVSIGLSNILVTQRFDIKRSHIKLQEQSEELNDLSIRDTMTKLYNNVYIFDFIAKSIEYSSTRRGHLCILILDIDDFKQINDTYGHLFGDHVIQEIASMLKRQCREGDIVGRYGGEEFIIVMSHIVTEVTDKIADRFRLAVAEFAFPQDVKITVSVGGAYFEGQTAEDLIAQADQNLREAKKTGKNKVIIS